MRDEITLASQEQIPTESKTKDFQETRRGDENNGHALLTRLEIKIKFRVLRPDSSIVRSLSKRELCFLNIEPGYGVLTSLTLKGLLKQPLIRRGVLSSLHDFTSSTG